MEKKVIVYTMPNCLYCNLVKDFLRHNDIIFTEKDVNTDIWARHTLRGLGTTRVPIIDIEGEIVQGFDEKKLRKLLCLEKN